MATAVVVGSLNMDLTMRVPRVPNAGETLFGMGFEQAEGGKGGNQAVAAARLGADIAMVGMVGRDGFGAQLCQALARDGVDIGHLGTCSAPTGVAMIMVDAAGENRIVLAPGANLSLGVADIDAASGLIAKAAFVVLQLEIAMEVVLHAARLAASLGVRVVLNPAPAMDLPDALLHATDYLIPNETEAEILTGITVRDTASAAAAARVLRGRGVPHVLITLGDKGVFMADGAGERLLPARRVAVVDTTAAGDCFIGGLVAGLCRDMPLDSAATLGIEAASLCVGRAGAQPALPRLAELSA